MGNFLAVNKDYFGTGLKSVDMLIISQIEEFERNNCKCFVSNKEFSNMFGESESTIKRSLDKLEDLKIIKRDTINNANGSHKSRQRTLSIDNKARFIMNQGSGKQGSNIEEARFKNEGSKVHNEPIKDKENKKKITDADASGEASASLSPYYGYEIKSDESNDIFKSSIFSDKKVIEVVEKEHQEDMYKSAEKIVSDMCFNNSDREAIKELANKVIARYPAPNIA